MFEAVLWSSLPNGSSFSSWFKVLTNRSIALYLVGNFISRNGETIGSTIHHPKRDNRLHGDIPIISICLSVCFSFLLLFFITCVYFTALCNYGSFWFGRSHQMPIFRMILD